MVLYSLADGEGICGPDYTMGGQGAKRTDDRDVDADTGEAGDGTGNRYGTGPRQGKSARYQSERAGCGMGERARL